jgi:hypothetical protein
LFPVQFYLAQMLGRLGGTYSGFISAKLLTRLSPPPKSGVDDLHQTDIRKRRNCVFSGRHRAAVTELVAAGLVSVAKLDDLTESHFEDLVIGRGDATLDDGEAATIAYGVEKGAITLIDERKATRICSDRYPRLTVGNSLDVLTHSAVLATLGDDATADAVFNALRFARMRVPPPFVEMGGRTDRSRARGDV